MIKEDNDMRNIFDIITKPGDRFEAHVTPTGRKVVNIIKDNVKFSAVKYPSGRIVETRSYMPGSKSVTKLLEKFHE